MNKTKISYNTERSVKAINTDAGFLFQIEQNVTFTSHYKYILILPLIRLFFDTLNVSFRCIKAKIMVDIARVIQTENAII